MVADIHVDREDGNNASSTGIPESESGLKLEVNPVPDFPFLSVQESAFGKASALRVPSDRRLHLEPSFDKAREPSQDQRADGAQSDEMTWDQLHAQRP